MAKNPTTEVQATTEFDAIVSGLDKPDYSFAADPMSVQEVKERVEQTYPSYAADHSTIVDGTGNTTPAAEFESAALGRGDSRAVTGNRSHASANSTISMRFTSADGSALPPVSAATGSALFTSTAAAEEVVFTPISQRERFVPETPSLKQEIRREILEDEIVAVAGVLPGWNLAQPKTLNEMALAQAKTYLESLGLNISFGRPMELGSSNGKRHLVEAVQIMDRTGEERDLVQTYERNTNLSR